MVYPASCDPADVLAANTFTSVRNWLYLDMACYGRYNSVAWSFMARKGITPDMQDGDMAEMADGKPDFIALNYYTSTTVSANPGDGARTGAGEPEIANDEPGFYKVHKNECLERTPFGWDIDPVGFRIALREIYDRYHLPLMVTENGLGGFDKLDEGDRVDDDYRIDFLRSHIAQAQLAITDGVDLRGYMP